MSDADRPVQIQREADAHLELGALLKKERDPEAKLRVGEILRSSRPLWEKIREIRRLDSQPGESPAPGEPPETVAQPFSRGLSVIRSIIKLPHPQVAYLEYVFRYHRKIKEFARRTHVLSMGAFLPRVRVDPEVQRAFRSNLQSDSAELLEICGLALRSGWHELDKETYNLMATLEKLCFEITAINFKVLNYRDRDLVDSLRNLETYFYAMHYRPDYVDRVTRALHKTLERNPEFHGERERVALLVSRILSPNLALPSLYNFLVGLNVVKLRRMVSFDDLICRELGDIINQKDYACPPETQGQINERVRSIRKELGSLRKQKSEVEHLKEVLKLDENGNPDFSPLQSLYDHAPGGQSFQADQNNLMVFGPRFLKAFDDTFFPLLNGRIRLAEVGRVAIFGRDRFPMQFHKLRQVTAELTRLNFSLHIFTRARFLTLKNTGKGAIAAEGNALQRLDEAVQILLDLAQRIEETLDSRLRRADHHIEGTPVEPVVRDDREFSLPAKDQRILSRDSINQKPVGEALKFLVAVCYAAGAFFLDRPILLTMERGERIEERINQNLTELQRIADPDVFRQEFAEQFHSQVDAARAQIVADTLSAEASAPSVQTE